MNCTKCGYLMNENTKFCPECGNKTIKNTKKTTEKHRLNISIDKVLWEQIKKQIPNVSEFVEDVFRTVIDSKDTDEFRIRTQIKAEQDQIQRSERQIELLESHLKLKRDAKYGDKAKQDRAWRNIWDYYKRYGEYSQEAMDNAVRVLGWDKERIHNLAEGMKALGRFINGVKAQTWEYAQKQEKHI